jgi:sulfur carrier protein ThiS
MHIKYILRGSLAAAIRSEADWYSTEQNVTGGTVKAAIRLLGDKYPPLQPLMTNSKGRLRAHIALEHNGDDVRQGEWLATPLSDGDRLELQSGIKGGC